jgi:glycosyltransferase involved in cell wall biosynthesis
MPLARFGSAGQPPMPLARFGSAGQPPVPLATLRLGGPATHAFGALRLGGPATHAFGALRLGGPATRFGSAGQPPVPLARVGWRVRHARLRRAQAGALPAFFGPADSMRVALDARYVREKPSGIGTYVQALVERIPAAAPDDRFLFWAHPLARHPLSHAPNTSDVIVRPGPNSPLPIWWPARYAPFDEVDLFHSPHNLLPRGVPCASVVTVHDVMAIERPELHLQGLERVAKRTYYPGAVWRALDQAAHLIAPSRAVADRIAALRPEAARRTSVVHEAADPIFAPAADPPLARRQAAELIGSDRPYLLVVGANAATKRHGDAVAAFAARVPPPWRLVLLQRQGASPRLARLARALGVADRIVWLPRVERSEVVTLMQSAGALVQPSVYEGFGLPVIEAMACGCPVVASDIPVFREIAAGAAAYAPPLDVPALGTVLGELVRSPVRREEMSAAGLERARRFSWARCAAETLDVYRLAANGRARSPAASAGTSRGTV